MKFLSKALFLTALVLSGAVFADCSFKVINHTMTSFDEQGARGTIGNLLIPRCSQNPSPDNETKENCATNASNILYEHPHAANSCSSTKGHFLAIQFSDLEKICKSISPQTSGNIVLNFPNDFICNFPKG
jgi:hypothetical protein